MKRLIIALSFLPMVAVCSPVSAGLASAMRTSLIGWRAAETTIDVLGNNLANSNTVGFKASTANFATQFMQSRSLGSVPTATSGGTNSQQVGLGNMVADITSNFSQDTIEISSSNTEPDLVPTVPGDGMPDFYYFDVEATMPDGAIYAGEVFPAGAFVIDPEGSAFGLSTIIVEGPPALGFDDNPNPGKNTAPRHANAGSVITAQGWNPATEMYQDTLLAMDIMDFGAGRDWAVGGIGGTMQLGIIGGTPLGQISGHPEDVKDILTKGLIYEGGQSDQFGLVTFANGSGEELRTYVNLVRVPNFATPVTAIPSPPPVPEPSTLTLLALGALCLAMHVRRRKRRPN